MTKAPTSLARQGNCTGYTAAQTAAAARLSKRVVLRALADRPRNGTSIVHGNETPLWTFDVLPAGIQEAITRQASASGLSVADYLDGFAKPWASALPLSQIDESCLEEARKLRAAQLPALERMDAPMFSPAERTRLSLEDYKRAFGHEISVRHWQRLLARTLWRAGVVKNYQNLAIYLPDLLKAKRTHQWITPDESRFASVHEIIQACADSAAPNNRERAAIWNEAFEIYNAGARTRRKQKQLRRVLVKFLFRQAPALAANEHALRVSFDRKFARWLKADKSAIALLDGREEKRGVPTAAPIPQDDLDRLTWHAAHDCGGRVAQAVRDFAERGKQSGLSDEMLQIITRRHGSKSRVNRRLASQLSSDVRGLKPYFLGKRAKDDALAHVERNYSKLASMQVICADDLTPPVYAWIPDGAGWYSLVRGQCLVFLDARSWRIVAYSLQPERNYSSLTIRTLMNRVCADWGIPNTWYYERGVWKRAHLVKGNAPAGWRDALSWPETKIGWENLGVNFRHAIRARSKPIEGVFCLLQNMMHGVRGYSGRDERRDLPEATKQAMDDVKFRRVVHPSELFLSFSEWDELLGRLIDRYNATSQDGKVLRGLSPDEAFEQYWPHNNPPARMDANSWHLVAHYVRPAQVTTNGISFRIGGKKFVYRNERTGRDRGKPVLIWFDPGNPDFLCVTDMNRKNPYLVERATEVDFLAEPGDPVLSRELAKAAAHSAYPRARYHTLKARFAPTFRRNIVDVETAETAHEINRQRTEKIAEQTQIQGERKRASTSFRRLGMATPERLRPGQADAARGLAELLQKDEETT